MAFSGIAKGVGVAALLFGSLVGLWYGAVMVLFAGGWLTAVGVVLLVAAFRGVILAFDLMWGRPQAFSKRPWERPWES